MIFFLWFGGSASGPYSSCGACAAICYLTDYDQGGKPVHRQIFEKTRTLGIVSENAAKFYGLILGLRCILHVLHDYPTAQLEMILIRGNSEIVINQMKGEYRIDMHSGNLRPFYLIAKSLMESVKDKITFEVNHRADALAQASLASMNTFNIGKFIFFDPNRVNLFDAKTNGRAFVVGTDFATATITPEILFDATTILELFGEDYLTSVEDPGKNTLVEGKGHMTVLGILSKPITFTVHFCERPIEVTIDDAIVVDFLPFDAHVSFDHPKIKPFFSSGWELDSSYGREFHSSCVPERFQQHPYWCKS